MTFAVSTDATAQPFVHLQCFQNGALVLRSWQNWFYGDHIFYLARPRSGRARGRLQALVENWNSYGKNGKINVLASTSFHANA